MISRQMLAFVQALVILCSPSLSYPVYGTKRYNSGRSAAVRMIDDNYSWGTPMLPYQQFPRAQRVPVNYYDTYPYTQDYNDDYYSVQEPITYPVYIPAPRTSKYEVYQAVLPYYYGQRAAPRQNYGYYGYEKSSDPLYDLEKEIQQETELEQREQAQPIGTEVLYENEPDDENINDANAAFVQNLIMSQMYQDDKKQKENYYDTDADYYYDEDGYGHWETSPASPAIEDKEDKDVRELKQLAQLQKPKYQFKQEGPTPEERMSMFRKEKQNGSNNNNNIEKKRNLHKSNKKEELGEYGTLVYATDDLPFSNRKPTITIASTKSPFFPKAIAKSHRKDIKDGQKEEVLMRPATPVRRPFAGTVQERSMGERKREPSVYDTIKHMLDMEKSLENNNRINELRPPMRKRIISSEDSLIHELSVLKKAHFTGSEVNYSSQYDK